MSQWILFEEFAVSEECRKSGRKLESELRHAYHSGGAPSRSSGRLGAAFSLYVRKILTTLSRWSGKILVSSGERLLRFAG